MCEKAELLITKPHGSYVKGPGNHFTSVIQIMVIAIFTTYFNIQKLYSFHRKYHNGFDQRVARQQLCKHGPTCNNTGGCVFYVVRATPSAGNGPMNSQSDT
jgi:hypothetical protein